MKETDWIERKWKRELRVIYRTKRLEQEKRDG